MLIKPYEPKHREPIVALSLRAWEPVFESIKNSMDPEVYAHFYPDWRESQRKAVGDACDDGGMHVWVSLVEEDVAGFVAVRVFEEDKMGEIYMIAVDPDAQGRGIGVKLSEFAFEWMKDAGVVVAMVETGGDPGHAPARRTYEKAGFRQWPVARYFKKL